MMPGRKDPAMRQLEVRLKPWESRRLRQLRDHATSARLLKRAMCLLLSAAGERAVDVARVTGLSLDAISDIRRRWRRRRLRSLRDRPRTGRPPRVTAAYRRELRRALRRGPRSCGRFVFTVWSIARLGTYLRRRTGIAVGVDWLRRMVHAEGFVIGRPAHTLEGKRDERAYRQVRRRLDRLKKGRRKRAHPTNCGTPTPRSSSCCRTSCGVGCPRDVS
jgi:transposase